MRGSLFLLATPALMAVATIFADERDAIAKRVETEARPIAAKYCFSCHGSETQEAEIDLDTATRAAELREHTADWQKAAVVLRSGDMPPKDSPQPTEEERKTLVGWTNAFLKAEAAAFAGDPGPNVLRRLNNVEYENTIRDATGVSTLRPAREFPADSGAGEGFTNAAAALAMSPAMFSKYLDAAKDVAAHAELLPDGVRFTPEATKADWTNAGLDRIRSFYRQWTATSETGTVVLQGITLERNAGGRLPVERYLETLIAQRQDLSSGATTFDDVAKKKGLSAKYLKTLSEALSEPASGSFAIDPLRAKFQRAKPEEAVAASQEIARDIERWQAAAWKFSSVGHIGKVGGPKAWQEPVDPWRAEQDTRLKLPTESPDGTVIVTFSSGDAGDAGENDWLVWRGARFVAPGRPDLPLRDLREAVAGLSAVRQIAFEQVDRYLEAVNEADAAKGEAETAKLAAKHGLRVDLLQAWMDTLGVAAGGPTKIDGHFTTKIERSGDYAFIQGWGSGETPLLLANSSDNAVRIPGKMKAHCVGVHPSPTLRAAVAWQSPIVGELKIEAVVEHVHPECGNGVEWTLDLRRGTTRRRLAQGIAHGATPTKVGPLDEVAVVKGDALVISVGPRDGNHSCDMTTIDWTLTDTADAKRVWSLADDVSPDVLSANPHADRQGNAGVWHFFTEPNGPQAIAATIPPGSTLSKWLGAKGTERQALAGELKTLLAREIALADPTAKARSEGESEADHALRKLLASFSGPLFGGLRGDAARLAKELKSTGDKANWGVDPSRFGKRSDGREIDGHSFALHGAEALVARLPVDLVGGSELVATVSVDDPTAVAQSRLTLGEQKPIEGAVADLPPLTRDEGKLRASFEEFRALFPAALCYERIVPVDEVVTLTLFHREDEALRRLLLTDEQAAALDRMWDELHFVAGDAVTLVDAFHQLMEYATQDSDPRPFEPLRKPIYERAEAYKKSLVAAEPKQLDAVVAWAERPWRRPLTSEEKAALRTLYGRLRQEELPHDEALRLVIAKILVSPTFLYKVEKPVEGNQPGPVDDWALASRLSYFLWSGPPDDELRLLAGGKRLSDPATLAIQMRRMMRDPRLRSLGSEFACQWLQVHEFDKHDEKSERHYPEFKDLRAAMHEETIRTFQDLVAREGRVTDLIHSETIWVNGPLAKHYGVPGPAGDEFGPTSGVGRFGRGGVLTQASILSKQSGASRTSPILRGNWISEVLLGERLPRPPKNVPQLPEEAPKGLTERQLIEKHSSDAACAKCHARIDPLGFALEGYDGIGKLRTKDEQGQPIEALGKLQNGNAIEGVNGLKRWLLEERRDDFVRQFNRKLLGYALGRGLRLSDEPLLDEMDAALKEHDYRITIAFEKILTSKQFRFVRGAEQGADE